MVEGMARRRRRRREWTTENWEELGLGVYGHIDGTNCCDWREKADVPDLGDVTIGR